MQKIVYTLSLILIISSCATVKLATPNQSDIDRINSKYPNYTINDIQKGKTLFEQNCKTCHALKNPTKKTEEQWKSIVPRMAKKANKKEVRIDSNEQELILKYLITMSNSKK